MRKDKSINGGGINMLIKVRNKVVSLLKQEEGQGMVEYALLVGLISVAAIAVIVLIGPKLITTFQSIVDNLH